MIKKNLKKIFIFFFVLNTAYSQNTEFINAFIKKIENIKSGHLKIEYKWKSFSKIDTFVFFQNLLYYNNQEYNNFILNHQTNIDCLLKQGVDSNTIISLREDENIYLKYNHYYITFFSNTGKYYLKDNINIYSTKLAPFVFYINGSSNLNKFLNDTTSYELSYFDNVTENNKIFCKYHIQIKYSVVTMGDLKIDKNNMKITTDDNFDKNNDDFIELYFNKKTGLLELIKSHIKMQDEVQYEEVNITPVALYNEINKEIYDSINNTYQTLYSKYLKQQTDTIPKKNKYEKLVEIAPSWKLPLINGDSLAMSDIKSKLMLIDFWYVGCFPCLMAIPRLVELDSLYSEKDLKIVGINAYDKTPEKISPTLKKLNVKYDIAYKGLDVAKKYGVMGYPKLFLIDTKTKKVIYVHNGYSQNMKEVLQEEIDNFLNKFKKTKSNLNK